MINAGKFESLKDRFVKHVRAKKQTTSPNKTPDVISVVRKEVDSEGVVRLKEESFNYEAVRIISVASKIFLISQCRSALPNG